MRHILFAAALVMSAGQYTWAQTLVPATSEDVSEFDRQLQQAAQAKQNKAKPQIPAGAKIEKSNFGAQVSEEANKLKDAELSKRKQHGSVISEQRRKDGKKETTAAIGREQSAGKSNAAREKIPPGQAKKQK